MGEALQLARRARALGEVPVGAVVVREGELLGSGFNRRETRGNPTAHAELEAISDALERVDGWRFERPLEEYFVLDKTQTLVKEPLRETKQLKNVDVWANIHGGGVSGQAGAFVMGVGRALLRFNSELEAILRNGKYLTRDARMIERKKYGRKKARTSFQFSKR